MCVQEFTELNGLHQTKEIILYWVKEDYLNIYVKRLQLESIDFILSGLKYSLYDKIKRVNEFTKGVD